MAESGQLRSDSLADQVAAGDCLLPFRFAGERQQLPRPEV